MDSSAYENESQEGNVNNNPGSDDMDFSPDTTHSQAWEDLNKIDQATKLETQYYAVSISKQSSTQHCALCDLDEEEFKPVGTGSAGGSNDTSNLHVMKYQHAYRYQSYEQEIYSKHQQIVYERQLKSRLTIRCMCHYNNMDLEQESIWSI